MAPVSTHPSTLFVYVLVFFFVFLSFSKCATSDFDESFVPLIEEEEDPLIPESDFELLEFPLNLEYLEAEFFLWATRGHGLDKVAPNLTMGGPPPIGARRAKLDALTRDIIAQFAYQEVGHIRALMKNIPGFPRPLIDLSASCFAKMMDRAFDEPLEPSFDPYANSINFLLASYFIPYVGFTGYVGMNPHLEGMQSRRLAAGLLGLESAQDAVIRALLYERARMKVEPYGITVAEFTSRISELRNRLGGAGVKDKGLITPPAVKGSGKKLPGSLLAGDRFSVAYERTPSEVLRIMYGKGTPHIPGGFFPNGANGRIARSYLHSA